MQGVGTPRVQGISKNVTGTGMAGLLSWLEHLGYIQKVLSSNPGLVTFTSLINLAQLFF